MCFVGLKETQCKWTLLWLSQWGVYQLRQNTVHSFPMFWMYRRVTSDRLSFMTIGDDHLRLNVFQILRRRQVIVTRFIVRISWTLNITAFDSVFLSLFVTYRYSLVWLSTTVTSSNTIEKSVAVWRQLFLSCVEMTLFGIRTTSSCKPTEMLNTLHERSSFMFDIV